jgi:hypothetical protein
MVFVVRGSGAVVVVGMEIEEVGRARGNTARPRSWRATQSQDLNTTSSSQRYSSMGS